MKMRLLFLPWIVLSVFSAQANDLCMEGVCIGNDVRELNVQWRPITISAQEQSDNATLLSARPVKEIFNERNELIVAPSNILAELFPYVVRRQLFDGNVMNKLNGVQAFCTSTTLTGELKHQGEGKIFVTFRAIPDENNQTKLRIIAIEKQFDIMAFSLRPQDREKDKNKRKELKAQYPLMVETRDLDTARPGSSEVNFASVLVGYRFLSDVSIPLTMRMRDTEDFRMMEDVAGENLVCKQAYGL